MESDLEIRTRKVKKVWYNDGTSEIFDGYAPCNKGIDAKRSGRFVFIPWTSIKKIEGDLEYY